MKVSRLFVTFLWLANFLLGSHAKLIDILDPDLISQGGGFTDLPDISDITDQVPPNVFVYDNPRYGKFVTKLTRILQATEDPDKLSKTIAALLRNPKLNRGIAVRAIIRTILNRKDSALFKLNFIELTPELAFPADVLEAILNQLSLPIGQRQCVRSDETFGLDNGIENFLWYFREDVILNSNHWNWHLLYPFFDETEVHRDRRGELFYYLHHGLMGRYHAERLSNGLNPISAFHLQKGGVIPEGFRTHLTDTNSKQNWQDRQPNYPLPNNVSASFVNISMDENLEYERRILTAIDNGYVLLADGSRLSIRNFEGIDILGDLIESSVWSKNRDYYGRFGFHNSGHIFIGNCVYPNDPEDKHAPGVMSDTATAVRDLIFYRWHTRIDEMYIKHKYTLTPYQPTGGEFPLRWQGVTIDSLAIKSRDQNLPLNTITTFWSTTKYTLRNGLDFQRNETQGPVDVCSKHLNHRDFDYRLLIRNNLGVAKRAVVRIFLAPRFNQYNRRYTMKEQHTLFFVLDTFSFNMVPGVNQISRSSLNSTLTIISQQALDELNDDQGRVTVSCGCGFPQHLLIPKGGPLGMAFDLFAMVTEESETTIPSLTGPPPTSYPTCKESYLYCGSLDGKYPDSKPMGYPFDRLPFSVTDILPPFSRTVRDLDEYVRYNGNMKTTVVNIVHINNPTAIL